MESDGCTFDYLYIHDGPTADDNKLGDYCTLQKNLPHLLSSGSSLFLNFATDTNTNRNGFKFEWYPLGE